MKKNKFLLGLMIIPCLLASCNKSMGFDSAKKWVQEHYDKFVGIETRNAMPVLSWDYSGTKGDTALNYIRGQKINILDEVTATAALAFEFNCESSSQQRPWISNSNGFINLVKETAKVPQLRSDRFDGGYGQLFTPKKEDIYKVNKDSLSIQFNRPFDSIGIENLESTSICTFDNAGFCTEYAVKINKTIDRDNMIKFKFYFAFVYEHDPIV